MFTLLKFLALVVLLNIIRYVAGYPFESWLIFNGLFGAMSQNPSVFNNQYSTFDWVTSYFYNFIMWLTVTWVFRLLHHSLHGSMILKSLQVFGLMFLFFASTCAILMNHYSHSKAFYFYVTFDGLLVFTLVAIANGLLYPLFFKK